MLSVNATEGGGGVEVVAAQLTGSRDKGEREPFGATSRHLRTVRGANVDLQAGG